MINEIFNEIFGYDDFARIFNKVDKAFYNELKELHKSKNEEKEKDETYYHKVVDKYEDGQHTEHIEKEVKDGKVLKDVNETYYKLEDKTCEKGKDEDVKNTSCEKECCCKDKQYYEEQLKKAVENLGKATRLLGEAQETINRQNDIIDAYKEHTDNLEGKLNKVKRMIEEK